MATAAPVPDTTALLATLRDELRAAWLKLRADHGQDELYGFGVYTTDVASYLTVTAFSERGLDAAVARAVAAFAPKGREAKLRKFALEQGGTPDDPRLQRQALRWSAGDSPLHALGERSLARSDAIVQSYDLESGWADDGDLDDDEFEDMLEAGEPAIDEVFRVLQQALSDLDREGLFGIGAERERLVLSIWQGDQSNVSRYEFAKALNPPAVTARFGREMNEGVRAYDGLFHGGKGGFEDDEFE